MNILKEFQVAEVRMSYTPKKDLSISPQIKSSRDVYDLLKSYWEDMEYVENVKLLLMNRANKVLGIVPIAKGGLSGCVIDVRIILQAALLSNASGFIISHNHPSGNRNPSDADIQITRKLKKSSEIMDLKLLDHIILTETSYYSMADEGVI